MRTNNWLKNEWWLVVALGSSLLLGCPAQPEDPTDSGTAAAARTGKTPPGAQQPWSTEQLMELSWLNGTPYATKAPITVTMNSSGSALFLQGALQPGINEAVMLPIVDGKLGKPSGIYSGDDYNRTCVVGHPSLAATLLITNYQAADGPVIDLIWQAQNGVRRGIPYNNEPNLPTNTLADTFYGLNPVYSWDGQTVIVPLRYDGLCLVDLKTGVTGYVKYPPYDFQTDNIIVQPLPDAKGRRLAYLSLYHQDWPEDQCKFALLDLDSHEWVFTMDLPWVIYLAGGTDPLNLPLLVSGSRPTEINTETKRQPRIALIDTASGTQKLLQFYGEPSWHTRIDAYGEYVVFMDNQEKAFARLHPADGKLDFDRRIFDDQAEIFCSPHATDVFIWNRSLLVPAVWSDSKQVQGYLDE